MNNKMMIGIAGAIVGLVVVLSLIFSGGSDEPTPAPQQAQTQQPAAQTTETARVTPSRPAAPARQERTVAAAPAPAAPQTGSIRPGFDIIRIEKSGDSVMAGTAPPNWGVRVVSDGATIGQTISSDDGSWVILRNGAFRSGNHKLVVEAASPDGSEIRRGDGFVTVALVGVGSDALVVASDPRAGSRVLQLPGGVSSSSGSMVFQTVDYDEGGRLILTGSAPANSNVRAYLNNSFIGDSFVREDGSWAMLSAVEVEPGLYELRLDQVSLDGQVVSRVVVPFQRPTAAQLAGLKEGHVVIQPGNNLWNISRVIYGSGARFTSIYEANKSVIRDPNLIYPGQIFETPGVAAPEYIPPSARSLNDLK